MLKQYELYHKHTYFSNVFTSDSTVSLQDYAERAKQYGQKVLCSLEHGWQGNYYQAYNICKANDLKLVIGAEAYWVKDRTTDDKSNCHIVILAKNENGRRALNSVLSEANLSGFYYRPRLDIPLILSLPKDDVIVTTGCVAYWKYDDIDEITEQFANHFGSNFYLEVQPHNNEKQATLNTHILKLRDKLHCSIIAGTDSHFIDASDAAVRDDFLLSKQIHYEDEENWMMDYPSGEELYRRFANQAVLSHDEIVEAMQNTLILRDVEEYDSPIFNDDIKMPTLYPEYTQEQRNEEYLKLVYAGWDKYKENVPEEEWPEYLREIEYETQTVCDTGMADYFIDNYYIIKKGIENGGTLTKTGRGCFTKEAIVTTTTGLKHINEVAIGDYVFDINGDPKKVVNTFKYTVNEPLVKINYAYMSDKFSPMICTKDHRILIRDNSGAILWKPAASISVGDYVCSPKLHLNKSSKDFIDLNDYNTFGYEFDEKYIYEKNPYRNKKCKFSPSEVAEAIGCSKGAVEHIANGKRTINKKNKKIVSKLLNYTGFATLEDYSDYIQKSRITKISRFIPNDYFMNFWIGCMYGDGFASADRTEIGLAINTETHKNNINKTVFKLIAQRVGISTTERTSKNRSLCQIYMNSNIFSNYVHTELFTSYKGTPKTFNQKLLEQQNEKLQGLLNGLTMTDGSFCESTRKSFDNASVSLVWAYKTLVGLTSGIPVSVNIRDAWTTTEGYKCKTSYKLRAYPHSNHTLKKKERTLQDAAYTYLPVWGVTEISEQETDVYDITVENSHSYMLNNIVVHNSGCSFLTNKLLGFSDIDRVSATVHLYPDRFMSKSRVLESKSLADIDHNEYPVEPFARAQKEVLGEEHSYPMLAYGTLKVSAAWKLYAKAQGVPFEIANEISERIKRYELAVKHADEDEKDGIDIVKFIGSEFEDIYQKSKDYLGVVTSWSIHPCSYLIYSGDIKEEVGLVRIKDHICCLMDGKWGEAGHFLKQDHLCVNVVQMIYAMFRSIGQEPPTVKELLDMCPPDDAAWSIYEKACCLGINQVEKEATAARAAKYKPHNIAELTAFVAAIRPGFASLYKKFENREHYSFGIESLDSMLQTPEMPESWLLYQESIMAVLNYAGIPMSECYTAIKNIAKKRAEKVLAYQQTFRDGMRERLTSEGYSDEKIQKTCDTVWKTIEDAASYSYNASHAYCVALDSLYCAWFKAHHPMKFYEQYIKIQEKKGDKDKINAAKEEAEQYFGIRFAPLKFGQDNRTIHADEERNEIRTVTA